MKVDEKKGVSYVVAFLDKFNSGHSLSNHVSADVEKAIEVTAAAWLVTPNAHEVEAIVKDQMPVPPAKPEGSGATMKKGGRPTTDVNHIRYISSLLKQFADEEAKKPQDSANL
jgi:hypothetical protein